MVDVRNPGEVALGSIAGALHVSLPSLINRLGELDPTRPTVVFCAGGYRSSIARSFLRSRGFADVSDVIGGFTAWAAYQHMQSPAPAGTPAIDVETVAADPNAFIFDVREQEEWDAGHVDGAVLIPMGDVVSRLAELPRDRQLVCMCRSGNRSGRVTTYLRGQGLDVVNLTGGALQWKSAGHPLVDAAGSAGTVS
jgi:rhodanese-related sulfurtransferase